MENFTYDKEINWTLLTKYLAQEANEEEINEVEVWLDVEERHKEILRQLYSSWQLSSGNKIDEKVAWTNVKRQLQNKKKKSFVLNSLFYKVAASLLLVVAVVFFIRESTKKGEPSEGWITVTSKDGVTVIELEDGSIVHLNKNTTLKYPQHFNDDKREIFIEGEGFFEVSKRDSLAFVVSTTDLSVRVLGTSFNVDAYSDQKTTAITVRSGRVSVASNSDDGNFKTPLLLKKGEIGVLVFEKDSLFKSYLPNDNYLAWKTRILEFDNSKLQEVVEVLNGVYNEDITIDNNLLKECLLTAKFNNKSLEEIMDILVMTYDLKVKKTSTRLILYGKGCN